MVPASDKCKPKFIVGNGDGMLQTDLDDREHQECNEAFEMDDEEEPKGMMSLKRQSSRMALKMGALG